MSNYTIEQPKPPKPNPTSSADSKSCDRIFMFTVDPRIEVDPTGNDGLGQLLQYIYKNPKARLRSMSARNVLGGDNGERWEVPPKDIHRRRSMGGRYMVCVESTADSKKLEAALGADDRAHDVSRPNAYRKTVSLDRPSPAAIGTEELSLADEEAIENAKTVAQWGLDKCGFSHVWKLDRPFDPKADPKTQPKPIGMIDIGSHLRHPELDGRIAYYAGIDRTTDSIADHAGAVAAIMCARRGDGGVDGEDMDGCCSARVEMYNVWSRNEGLDQAALYEAVRAVIDGGLPVLNMSIWLDEHDPVLAELLEECERENVVVVAAIGNLGTDTKLWPAAYPDVVAVVASDPADRRHKHSSYGKHATIAAPGENILTAYGNSAYDRMSGTSFAAPFVTAAVWLAKQERPDLNNVQVRQLLKACTVPMQGKEVENCGRLDMTKLVDELKKIPKIP